MTKNKSLNMETMPSPVGELTIVWDDDELYALEFGDDIPRLQRYLGRHGLMGVAPPKATANPVRSKLEKYFDGELQALEGLPVMCFGTDFSRSVWRELRQIPAGETRSYGEIARNLGRPTACRAVGAANGRNPIAIVVPCHRVIGQDGTLTGYAGGLERKQWLLKHEGAI